MGAGSFVLFYSHLEKCSHDRGKEAVWKCWTPSGCVSVSIHKWRFPPQLLLPVESPIIFLSFFCLPKFPSVMIRPPSFFFFFWDKFHYVALTEKLRDLSVFAFWVLELKVCTTMPGIEHLSNETSSQKLNILGQQLWCTLFCHKAYRAQFNMLNLLKLQDKKNKILCKNVILCTCSLNISK